MPTISARMVSIRAGRHFVRTGSCVDRARSTAMTSDDFDFFFASFDAHAYGVGFVQKLRERADALRDVVGLFGHCRTAFAQERIEPGLLGIA